MTEHNEVSYSKRNYFKNNMRQEKSSDLVILNVEKDFEIDSDQILINFITKTGINNKLLQFIVVSIFEILGYH